jgi:hypothetical protein
MRQMTLPELSALKPQRFRQLSPPDVVRTEVNFVI